MDVQIPQCKLLIDVQDNKDKIDDTRDDTGIVTYYVIAVVARPERMGDMAHHGTYCCTCPIHLFTHAETLVAE